MAEQSYGPLPKSIMSVRCRFGHHGQNESEFDFPRGFCLGVKGEVIVADTYNHRIQAFTITGNFLYQFGTAGRKNGCLWYPRKVAVFQSSSNFVVCDRGKGGSRLQVFTKNWHFEKNINIQYINIVAGLATTSEDKIVAVESVSPTVFIFSKVGALLQIFDCSKYMNEPSDIAVFAKELYICDFVGCGVVVFSENGEFLRRIRSETVMSFPSGIAVSADGDIIIGDSHKKDFHIAVFSRLGSLIAEFECPDVYVSRCYGLKLTSEGFLVTVDRNSDFVLIFNPLFVPYTLFDHCLYHMQHLSLH